MFSGDRSIRQDATEKHKYSSGAQVLLSVILLGCSIAAVAHYDDYYFNYHIGGFSCGILGFIAGCLGLFAYHKASRYRGDDLIELQSQLKCKLFIQMTLGFTVFIASVSGVVMVIRFFASEYESNDSKLKIHLILAICIVVGIVLLLCASFCTFRTAGTR